MWEIPLFPSFPGSPSSPSSSSPSTMKDDGLHAERSFPPHPHSIQLLFSVYFYTTYLLEPQTNTSPSSGNQSGCFIGKSNQDSRGKSFLNVLAKQRARLNCLGYKKDRVAYFFFSPLFLDSTIISAHHSTVFKAQTSLNDTGFTCHSLTPPSPPPPGNRVTDHLKHSKFRPPARPQTGISVTSLLEIKGSNREAEHGAPRSGDGALMMLLHSGAIPFLLLRHLEAAPQNIFFPSPKMPRIGPVIRLTPIRSRAEGPWGPNKSAPPRCSV